MKLQGKVAVVTGASRGIGHAIARVFAQEGAKVVICYNRSETEASNLAAEIQEQGRQALLVRIDVSKADEVKKMSQKTVDEFGRIDILVNNAGIIPASSSLFSTTDEMWNKTIDINLRGAWLCSKEVAPTMLAQKKGKIINISSICGLAERSALGNTPYVVSKAGMIGLTRSLAVNLAPYVNVNAICPGFILTDRTASLSPESATMLVEESLLKRTGRPEEIGSAALFLASDESDFITGEIVTVSGGRAMR